MDDLTQNALPQYLRSDRPLFGLTVLVVEDSKFACEGIRLLCLRSGARIRWLIACGLLDAIFRCTALRW